MSYDWNFGEDEYLAVIVSLVCPSDVYGDEKTFDTMMDDYNEQTVEKLYQIIQEKPAALALFNAALEAIKKRRIKCLSKKKDIIDAPALVTVHPLSFIEWAKKNGTEIPYFLRKAANEMEEEAYIDAYSERPLNSEDFHRLMREPLWDLNTAILYLHGFQSCDHGTKGFRSETMDSTCVRRVPEFRKIRDYAKDASNIGALKFFGNSLTGREKVKPTDFISWSNTLHIHFTCYQWLLNQTSEEPEEEHKMPDYVTPDMQLMFDAIGKFWAGYNLSRPNPSIAPTKRMVVEWLVQEARSRRMDFSRTRAEHMDTIMRCPESRKGGNTL